MIDTLYSYSWILLIIVAFNIYFGLFVLGKRIENSNFDTTTKKYTYVVFFLSIIGFLLGILLLYKFGPEWGQYEGPRKIRGNIMRIVIPFIVLIFNGILIYVCYQSIQIFKSSLKRKKK